MLNFDNIEIGGIKFHLVSVDDKQITFTNALTYRDYLDMNYVVGKNKLKYNVFNLTMFFHSVNNGYKSKMYKAILTKGNMNDGYKLVFDENITGNSSNSKMNELFKKYKVKEKLD